MLLLNTDLHVADVGTRMSRSDFVVNTMAVIKAQTTPSSPVEARTPSSSHGTDQPEYLDDLSVAEPTLENVFISLTGKELRD